jgi:predicted PurR-regulated permease PerM
MVIVASVGLTAWLLSQVSEVAIPVVVATLLSALLHPIKRFLQRFMPNGLAAGITVLGTLAILIGLFSFVGSQFSTQFGDLTNQVSEGLAQIRDWISSTFRLSDTQITEYLSKARDELTSGDTNLGARAAAAGLTASHVVAGFFLAMFSLFFFLSDGPRIWGWLVRLFPRGARDKVHSSGLIAWNQVSAFARATVLVAAVDALGIGVGAAILGVPFASGIGLLVFFGAFVPIIGAALSGSVAVILALVALGPVKALIMVGIVVAVQQLESHLLQPILIGRAMSVHPLAVVLAIAAGVVVAGIVGALIAVPSVAVLNAVGHHLLDGDHSSPQDSAEESAPDSAAPAQTSTEDA